MSWDTVVFITSFWLAVGKYVTFGISIGIQLYESEAPVIENDIGSDKSCTIK